MYDDTTFLYELDASGNVVAVNTFGAQGLVFRHITASNTSTFYTFDERGNVAQRTEGTGVVLSTNLYDAYDKPLAGSKRPVRPKTVAPVPLFGGTGVFRK